MLLLDEPSLGLAPTLVDVVFDVGWMRERGSRACSSSSARSALSPSPTARTRSRTATASDLLAGRRRTTPTDDRRLLRVTGSRSGVDAQTLINSIGLGSVYALMAVGVGLVFGVLRLVNFAYGQLIMAGAYVLALGLGRGHRGRAAARRPRSRRPGPVLLAMELAVFRPLRGASPATMLVTTFASRLSAPQRSRCFD